MTRSCSSRSHSRSRTVCTPSTPPPSEPPSTGIQLFIIRRGAFSSLYLLEGSLLEGQHGGVEALPAPGQLGAGLHGVGHRALVVLSRSRYYRY